MRSVATGWILLAGVTTAQSPAVDELLRTGRFAEAEIRLRETLRSSPGAETKAALAAALAGQFRWGDAEPLIADACARNPRKSQWWVLLAKCRFERGACEAAGEALDKALALSPDADTLDARAACAMQAGRPADAEPLLRRALTASPSHVSARVRLGRLLVDAGKHADALPHFDAALAVEPRHADALYFSALCLRAEKRLEEALTRVDIVFADLPGHVGAAQLRASLLRSLGRKDAAALAWDSLRRLVAEDDALAAELASLRIGVPDAARRRKAAARALALGRFDLAAEQLRAAAAIDPRHPELAELASALERARGGIGAASRPGATK